MFGVVHQWHLPHLYYYAKKHDLCMMILFFFICIIQHLVYCSCWNFDILFKCLFIQYVKCFLCIIFLNCIYIYVTLLFERFLVSPYFVKSLHLMNALQLKINHNFHKFPPSNEYCDNFYFLPRTVIINFFQGVKLKYNTLGYKHM